MPTVADAMGSAFCHEGVTVAFGLMGDGNMDFMVASRKAGIAIVDARHEAAAVAMADGFARYSGAVGVATVTCGPGLTQVGTSLMTASRHGTPLIVVAGDTSTNEKGMFGPGVQDMDQGAFAQASGALHHQVRTADTVLDDIRMAFLLARSRSCPVVLSVPMDVQADRAPTGRYRPSSDGLPARSRLIPSTVHVDRCVELIAQSHRPLVVAGSGAVAADAREAIEALADRIGAALGTSLLARGLFDGSPWDVGVMGGFALGHADAAGAAADLVISVGSSLSPQMTRMGQMFPNATIVQINNSDRPHPGRPVGDMFVLGDARLTVEAITASLERAGMTLPGFRGDPEFASRLESDARLDDLEEAAWPDQQGTVDIRRLMLEIDEALPRKCLIVAGAGHFWSTTMTFLKGYRTRRFISSYDFGSIGQGFPTAIGAALADPALPVVAFEGDGSMYMNLQELDTVSRYRPRLLTFVLNDQALGSEYHKLRTKGHDPAHAVMPSQSFAAIARSFGLAATEVRRAGDATRSIETFQESDEPQVVDVALNREVISRYYRRLHFDGPTGR